MKFIATSALLFNALCHGFSPMSRPAATKSIGNSPRTILHEQRIAEKVLANPKFPPEWPYTAQDLARMDETDGGILRQSARLVTNIDDTSFVRILCCRVQGWWRCFGYNTCSSWISHYPEDWKGENVLGLGNNEYELSQSKVLDSYDVKDFFWTPHFHTRIHPLTRLLSQNQSRSLLIA